MYGEEYHFLGTVAEFVSAVETYSHRIVYRGTPGPFAPSDIFTRRIPLAKEFQANITYAEFEFTSRFTRFNGEIYVNSLPFRKALVVTIFPHTAFEDEYAEQSLHWAWDGLKNYLIGHGWLEGVEAGSPNQPHTSHLLDLLANQCSEEELRTFCFKLDVDYESLQGSGKKGKARELIIYLSQRRRIPDLVTIIKVDRPDIIIDNS